MDRNGTVSGPLDWLAEFPIAAEATYLNHAASAPLPTRSADALRRFVADRQRLFHLYQAGTQDYDAGPLRRKLGQLLGAEPESIGFVPTTSDGLSAVLNGLPWEPGDNVVLPEGEFPSLVYACQVLEARGVRALRVPVAGAALTQALLERIDGRTRAVVASLVHWQTGDRIDLDLLGQGCRARGVLSVVDAIQGLGAVPVDARMAQVDVLVAGTYKWLLGIQGLAVLYLGAAALERITPDRAGWQSMADGIQGRPGAPWAPGPRRFEVGGGNDPALVALEPSVDLLLEAGPARVLAHTGAMLDRLLAAIRPLGIRIHSDLSPGVRSAFINLGTGDPDRDAALARALAAERIIVARRGPGLRVAPHLHTRPEQMDRMAERVAAFLRTRGA
jgi:selenocysteine lyase/cysteine desulfurase